MLKIISGLRRCNNISTSCFRVFVDVAVVVDKITENARPIQKKRKASYRSSSSSSSSK